MKTDAFDYHLPRELIAQHPLPNRDDSRLLVMHRDTGLIEHRRFKDLGEYMRPGDILVANDSKVFPARLYGRKSGGGKVEILLLERLDEHNWKTIVGGKRLDSGKVIELEDQAGIPAGIIAVVAEVLDGPQRLIHFETPIDNVLQKLGHIPLPPYIHEELNDAERYQTIYARSLGSAAAPTAGLHFTGDMLFDLRGEGVLFDTVTLHVGLDTFKPVEVDNVFDHQIHSEKAILSPDTARRINEAKLAGGRLVAVGTTAVRTLETGALRSAGIVGSLTDISRRDASGETTDICPWKPVAAFEGPTDLFIAPGYRFRAVDRLITNFHLPKSSLLMLVSAFAGRELILEAYESAVMEQYRFYSFGDAMLII
jgi:S-adenosylmethionine:tRNA ribosyltransferase-isomerase